MLWVLIGSAEALPMSTHNICLCWEIRKIFKWILLLYEEVLLISIFNICFHGETRIFLSGYPSYLKLRDHGRTWFSRSVCSFFSPNRLNRNQAYRYSCACIVRSTSEVMWSEQSCDLSWKNMGERHTMFDSEEWKNCFLDMEVFSLLDTCMLWKPVVIFTFCLN